MKMNKIAAAVLVVVGAAVFTAVFVQQFQNSRNQLSELLRDDYAVYQPDVAGATVVNPNGGADQPAQIDHSINAMNLDSIDNNSMQIEEQLKMLDQ